LEDENEKIKAWSLQVADGVAIKAVEILDCESLLLTSNDA